jgi:hypothetical protein
MRRETGESEEIRKPHKKVQKNRKLRDDEDENEVQGRAKNNFSNKGYYEENYEDKDLEMKRKSYFKNTKKNNIETFKRNDESSEYDEGYREVKRNSQKVIPRDSYSCQYCEEVYKVIIFQSLPVKVFECFYCHNTINSISLDFYYKKYDKELRCQPSSVNPSQLSCSINPIITPKEIQEVKIEKEPSKKVIKIQEAESINLLATKKNNLKVERNREEENTIDKQQIEYPKPSRIKEEVKKKEEIKIEEENEEVQNIKRKLIEQREEKRQRKLAEEKRKEEKKKTEEKPVKILSKSINIEEKENTEKFDKKWVDWNETQNLEKKEELKRNKELIEVNVCDNNEIKGSSLADAFKKKKKDMVKRLENNEKEIVVPNNNENTMIEHRKNSKNVTGNDIQDETNCTRADLRGDNTTIGEILNDSELRPVNISSKILSEKKEKKKNKYEQKNVIVEENEPSKELLDRLIYGKKAEVRVY